MKSFGKLNCQLYMNERILIHESIRKGKEKNINTSINTNSEIYGACRHKPKFHRFTCCPPSTDEGRSPERCEGELVLTNHRVPIADVTNMPFCQEVSNLDEISEGSKRSKRSNRSVGTRFGSGYEISVDV